MYYLVRFLIRWWQRRRGPAATDSDAAAGSNHSPRRAPRASGGRSAAARGPLALLAHQVKYDLLTSFRNPRARFMTMIFPIVLLVVFNGVFGHGTALVDGVRVTMSRFYVPGILAMSIVVAAYATLVISVSALRENGVLKRRRATPASPALLIAGQALATVGIVATMSTVLLIIAKLAYGVGIAPAALASIACTAIVGTCAFAAIGYAVSGLIGSPDAAQPIVQATMLPLWFISGVFIPVSNLSRSLKTVGEIFPVEHLANSLHLASVHSTFSAAISGTDLLVLAAWAVAAGSFAAWRFSWLPSAATA